MLNIYEREYFSKYPQYGYSRRKVGLSMDDLWEPKKKKYFPVVTLPITILIAITYY
jgi:hypothetical protein